MPTTDSRPARADLITTLKDAHRRHERALVKVDRHRAAQLSVLVELVYFRGVEAVALSRHLGYRSDESIPKRLRPVAAEYGLTRRRGVPATPAEANDMRARWTDGHPTLSDKQLWNRLDKEQEAITEAGAEAASVLQDEMMPTLSTLVIDHQVSVTDLRAELGIARRDRLYTALKLYWAREGIDPPRAWLDRRHGPGW